MTHLPFARALTPLRAALVVAGVVSASASDAGVTLAAGFEGTSQLANCALGQCFRPPDTMGAVGTTQFLETTNGSITVYDKSNGAVLSRVSMPAFWGATGLPAAANGDQRVLFDHYTNRWIMNGFGATGNIVNIAVSDTANALGTWRAVAVPVLASGTADYPTLAMDDKAVYIGTNNFTPGFTGTSLLSIPKSSLFGGAPATTGMTQINTPYPAGPNNGFAIQAALNWGGNPTGTTAVIADSRDTNDQVFYKLLGNGAPGVTQTASTIIAGTGYDVAGRGRQPDGTRLVDTLSPRISANAVQAGNLLFSTAVVEADASIGDYAAIRWTVVDATSGALLSSGKIQEAGFDFYEGSIAVNEFGEAVIGYNRSGFSTADANGDGKEDGRISFLAQAYRVIGNALVEEGDDLLLRVSEVNDYRCGVRTVIDTSCRQRWGDYAAVTFDPNDHHTFWAIGEYAADWAVIPNVTTTERAIWHTYIAALTVTTSVPEPGTLALVGLAMAGGLAARRRPMPA